LGNAATIAAQTNTIWDNAGGASLTNKALYKLQFIRQVQLEMYF
jgi:hypothetical protein